MASSLLDELPCLLDEADELMARLALYIKLLPTKSAPRQSSSDTPAPSSADDSTADDQLSVAVIRASLSSSETESALKFFAKQFLTSQPVPIEKVLSQLPAPRTLDAPEPLQFVAKRVFHLMKRVHHWQRAAWGIVTQFFAEAAYLTFAKHRLLTALLLNTLVKYVKVHLLWTSCPSIASLLAVHTFVQYSNTLPTLKPGAPGPGQGPPVDPSTSMYSPLDRVDHHLREYVLCFGSSPLLRIQQDFQQHPDGGEIARNLTALALSCFESFVGCHDLEQLRNQGAFDIETLFHGSYVPLPVYEDLLFSHEQEEWVLCVALCVPQQLRTVSTLASSASHNGVQLWDFVQVIAQDRLVLSVFRDVAVNLHTLLYQQIASMASMSSSSSSSASSSASSSSTSGGQVPLKKLMSALSKQALRTCAEQHAQRAQFTTWLLQSATHLLTVRGALVAPLFAVLLGACRLARNEIEWLLCHEDQPQSLLLPAHVKAKHLQRAQRSFTGNAGICGQLLALIHNLRALMKQNLHFVRGYYEEFLSCGDADVIAHEIQELLNSGDDQHQVSGGVALLGSSMAQPLHLDARVQQILSSFAAKERYQAGNVNSGEPSSNSNRVKASSYLWRREWRQLSVVLLTNETASSKRLPDSLLSLMERACRHTKYVESAANLLGHHAQLSKWCWRPGLFEKLYQQLLLQSHHSSPNGAMQAIAMLEIVDATISGDYALDEIVEETEAQEQLLRLQELYRRMEQALGVQLERAIDSVVSAEAALHSTEAQQAGDLQGSKVDKSQRHHEAQIASSQASNSLKSSESRLPSAISSMRSSGRVTAKARFASQASNTLASSCGPLGSLVKAEEALCKLASAIFKSRLASSAEANNVSKLGSLVERHVRVCFTRFLRGLVDLADATSSSSSRTPACKLRCSLEHASFELQRYVTCVQRLFRNATFVDLRQVVMHTLASESQPPERVEAHHQWNLLERLAWLYRSMLQLKCAPLASAAKLIASRREQSFVSFQLSAQTSRENAVPQFARLEALQSLREIIGASGIHALGASIMSCVCSQVQALGLALEHDRIALIRFDKSIDAPYSELAMAVKQMARLDEIVMHLVQIGLHLFFAELLQQVEPSFSIVSGRQRQQQMLNRESDPPQCCVWRLLPVAFAASFHSELWRRTKYLEALDATDTNAHMSCTALLYLLQLVGHYNAPLKPASPARDDEELPQHAEEPGSELRHEHQQRELLRCVVRLSSQAVLGLRAAAKELPSPAMLAAVRMFAELAAVPGRPHEEEEEEEDGGDRATKRLLELGILDECLPDIVFRVATLS